MTNIRQPATSGEWGRATALLWEYVSWIRRVSGLDPLVEQPAFRAEIDDLAAAYTGADASLYLAVDGAWGPPRAVPRPVAEPTKEVVGMVAVRHHPDGTSELKRLYVAPEHRGRGLASRLVGRVIAAAADRGSTSIWLETVRGFMDPAIALYERHGFTAVARPETTFQVEAMVVMARPTTRGIRPGSAA